MFDVHDIVRRGTVSNHVELQESLVLMLRSDYESIAFGYKSRISTESAEIKVERN